MVAQGVDLLLPQVVLRGSAAVQRVAEHHDAPALGHICMQDLQGVQAIVSKGSVSCVPSLICDSVMCISSFQTCRMSGFKACVLKI